MLILGPRIITDAGTGTIREHHVATHRVGGAHGLNAVGDGRGIPVVGLRTSLDGLLIFSVDHEATHHIELLTTNLNGPGIVHVPTAVGPLEGIITDAIGSTGTQAEVVDVVGVVRRPVEPRIVESDTGEFA